MSLVRTLSLVSTIALAASFLACGGPSGPSGGGSKRLGIKHEHTLKPGKAHHPGITRAIIFPMNATVQRATGLDGGDDDLIRLTVDYLESKGVSSTILDAREYNRANGIAVRKARKKMLSGESGVASDKLRFEDIVPEILAELDSDAQIAVLPNVMMRPAEYSGGKSVRWDGVRRRERGTRGGGMSGTTSAGTLFTIILDAKGDQIFSAYGGLDLIYELDMSKKKYVTREDLFEDLENLAEGICVSLHPYFGDGDC